MWLIDVTAQRASYFFFMAAMRACMASCVRARTVSDDVSGNTTPYRVALLVVLEQLFARVRSALQSVLLESFVPPVETTVKLLLCCLALDLIRRLHPLIVPTRGFS